MELLNYYSIITDCEENAVNDDMQGDLLLPIKRIAE